jgi:hypothetical protein
MNLQIHAKLELRCIAFLRRKLAMFDPSGLDYFRLYDRTGKTANTGVWGRCAFPNRKKKLGYRIRCSVSITERQFPYPVKWAVGTKRTDPTQWQWVWREDRFQTLEEAFVWIAGHEAYHWLRHSRQIPGQNYETQANRCGFVWLDEWRSLSPEGEYLDTTGNSASMAVDAPPPDKVNTSLARIYYTSGKVAHFKDQKMALTLWRALSKGVRAAFRGAHDTRPVYPWNQVDAI